MNRMNAPNLVKKTTYAKMKKTGGKLDNALDDHLKLE